MIAWCGDTICTHQNVKVTPVLGCAVLASLLALANGKATFRGQLAVTSVNVRLAADCQ